MSNDLPEVRGMRADSVRGLRVEDLIAATVPATASQWPARDLLSQLPAEVREKALRYFDVYSQRYPRAGRPRASVGEALNAAFPWHRTREGADYWLRVYNDVMGLETITPCVPEVSTNHLTVNTVKLNDFFEY